MYFIKEDFLLLKRRNGYLILFHIVDINSLLPSGSCHKWLSSINELTGIDIIENPFRVNN